MMATPGRLLSMALAVVTFLVLFLALTASTLAQESEEKPIDRRTRLVVDVGLDEVKARCLECHTTRLILQARADREQWIGMIRWMQETQGLETIPPEEEAVILDYLVENYGIEAQRHRRVPLSEELLPPTEPLPNEV